MKAISTACIELEVNRLLKVLIYVGAVNFSCFGWYVRLIYGIHLERLSVNC
jgi:hypothetical protein